MPQIPLIVQPDVEDPDCADIFVDGTVAGVSHRFVLDTGAARTQLICDAAVVAAARPSTEESWGVFGRSDQRLTEVSQLKVGPITADRLTVSCVAPGAPAQNLLGMDVLGSWCCEVSFGEASLVVRSEPAPAAEHALSVGQGGQPLVDVGWGDVVANGCWDTGAGITVVDSGFVAAHPALFTPAQSSHGTDANGTTMETPTFVMSGPTIGGVEFRPHRVAAVDLSGPSASQERRMEMILGYTTLAQADWLMDFPQRRWSLRLRGAATDR